MTPLPTAADGHKDYSGTPLWKKLGIRDNARVLLAGAPEGFEDLLEPLPDGAAVLARSGRSVDVALLFANERADLDRRFARLAQSIRPDGRLWVAWPKKASKIPTDLDFDAVQGMGLGAGLVDNKSASITDEFQGLQFVVRLRDRPKSQEEQSR
jgi:hypothetical protein